MTNDRHKFSVSLSPASAKLVAALRQETDADTDSEVFRNALRLHHWLLGEEKAGRQLRVGDETVKLANVIAT